MNAVVLREVGGDLALEEWEEPAGTGLDVRAAGVNFADVLIRRGTYPQMPALPFVPGNEVAGVLDGKRVAAFTRGGGGYAERVEIDPQWVFELPAGASFAAGASFLTTYLTAYIPLASVAHRETVLVHAGAGGVGSAAIQLARHFGATVYATASSDEKREVIRGLGAEPLAYDDIDELRVDCVLDPVGGEVFTRSLPLLNPVGAVVAVGFAAGLWQDPSVQWLVGRNATVVVFYLGRLLKLRPDYVQRCARELLALWRHEHVEPLVGATFALADARDAHALIEARRHVGKVVLEP